MQEATGSDAERTARRVYGVLATSLNEALAEARTALVPHAQLLPEGRIADLDRLLEEFARRRVRIAVYGEVKAGKSTLINAIAGAELSPAAFDPLTSVPVRLTWGPRTTWRVGAETCDTVEDLARLMRDGVECDQVEVETNLDLLQLGGQVDLLDTPGVGSEEKFDDISSAALRSLDAVVLVVRYPALFTRFTRGLMEGLESDIGRLFVVWNLDADCAELGEEERARHAETLRQNVAGAHELHLVDARAGLRAAQSSDAAGVARSGLTAFTDALARFASSDKREVAALREAAKRARAWLGEAEQNLAARHKHLDAELGRARKRIEAVERRADDEARAEQARFDELRAALGALTADWAASAARRAAAFAKTTRATRRGWIRSGDTDALEAALDRATAAYADAVEAAASASAQKLVERTREYGAQLAPASWARRVPSASPVAPAERRERAAIGRFRLARRALWRHWYLPGVSALETRGIRAEVEAEEAWFESFAAQGEDEARSLLDARLGEIRARAGTEIEGIKTETNFDAKRAEFDALTRDIPIVAGRRTGLGEISREARGLID